MAASPVAALGGACTAELAPTGWPRAHAASRQPPSPRGALRRRAEGLATSACAARTPAGLAHSASKAPRRARLSVAAASAAAEAAPDATAAPSPGSSNGAASHATPEELKLKVLSLVAGLDRGVAASPADCSRVLGAVEELEKQASLRSFQDAAPGEPSTFGLGDMQGLWRLVFSSGFAAGSLGGLRPGPPTGRLPIIVGQVLQRIDLPSRQLDNIVELRVGLLPWPLPQVEVTASLAHSLDVLGSATFRIIFDKTTVNAGTFDAPSPVLPPISTPDLPDFLRSTAPARAGQFETTYLDKDFRVSRGDLGELRIFVRA